MLRNVTAIACYLMTRYGYKLRVKKNYEVLSKIPMDGLGCAAKILQIQLVATNPFNMGNNKQNMRVKRLPRPYLCSKLA